MPVRFDTDKLEINMQGFRHGAIPSIPIVEIRSRRRPIVEWCSGEGVNREPMPLLPLATRHSDATMPQ